MMREVLRLIQPGGVLLLSTPDGALTIAKRILGTKCEDSHERELSSDEVQALVHGAGGTVETHFEVPNLVLPAGRLGSAVKHLVGDRDGAREALRKVASAAGYRTLLYVVRTR